MYAAGDRNFLFAVFSFDPRTGDLSRHGHRLRITEQARQVLLALLENAGQIVTREELRKLLWPGGETLDWDHSINKVVAQLRAALRDNARETKFIETVPKRGYRFVAPVTLDAGSMEAEAEAPAVPTEAPVLEEPRQDEPAVDASEAPGAPAVLVGNGKRSRTGWARVAVAGCVATLLLLATAKIVLRSWGQRPTNVVIGIPPFEAVGDGSHALAETFRLDLASAVADLPSVQVRAAHSLPTPLRDDASIRAAALSLHLDLLLFGNLVRNGNGYELNIELVKGADAAHVASFHYRGSSEQLGSTRDQIQRDLFDQLGLAAHRGWRSQPSTRNAQAYQSYLQARLDLSGWADAPVENALKEFEDAIRQDPGFANAYAGLASAYVVLAEHGAAPREASYSGAQQAAERALALAPANAEAHAILGQVALRRDWNFEVAERELQRAISLDPNQALYHLWLSVMLCDQGRSEESLREIDTARALDPLWAPVYRTEVFLANAAGQYGRALTAAEKLISLMPNWPLAYDQRAWTYWHQDRYAEALADWERMAQLDHESARMRLEDEGLEAFRRGGVAAYARVRLKAIQSGFPYRHAAMDFAPVEWDCIAGDYEKALLEVDKMVARRDPDVLQLGVNRTLLPLHGDPRFRAALVRAGIRQPADAGSSTVK